jgi:hypothetical protein
LPPSQAKEKEQNSTPTPKGSHGAYIKIDIAWVGFYQVHFNFFSTFTIVYGWYKY